MMRKLKIQIFEYISLAFKNLILLPHIDPLGKLRRVDFFVFHGN